MKLASVEKWLLGLWAALVTGASTSFLAALGISGANTVGITVPPLSWRQLGILTLVGGLVGVAAFFKQSPIPQDEVPPPQCPKIKLQLWLVGLLGLSLCGCATVQPVAEHEADAARAAEWITENSGLIEMGVSGIATAAIYGTEEGTDKDKAIAATRVVASNILSLLNQGKVDPDSVRAAFRIKEPWFDNVMEGAASLYESKYWKGKKNGYKDCGESLLRAVAAGLLDATGGR